MTDYKKKALKGTIVIFVMTLITAFLSYLFRRILVTNLTKAEYGLFYSVMAVVGILTMFGSLGLADALSKFISEYLVKKKNEMIKSSITMALILQLGISIVLAIIVFLFSGFLSRNYFQNPLSFFILNILLIGFVLSCFLRVFHGVFSGFQRMEYLSSLEFARIAISLLTAFILFFFTKSVFIPAIVYVFAYLVIPFIFTPLLTKVFPEFFKIKPKLSVGLGKKLLGFGIPVSIGGFGWLALAYTDTLTLTYFKGIEAVALYNVALPIATLLGYFSKSIVSVIYPMTSELWAKRKEYLSTGLTLLQKYSFVMIIPFALIAFSFPDTIISILFDDSFVPAAPALQILSLGTIAYTVASINNSILIAIGKPKLNTKIVLIGAGFNLFLNLLLIPKMGITGAAIATSTSYLLMLLMSTIRLRGLIKTEFPWLNWFKSVIAGGIFVLIVWFLKMNIDINVWLKILACFMPALLVYILLVFTLGVVNKRDVKEVLGYIFKKK